MTSKEALESWFNVISTNDKIRWEEHYKVIKKDLEVLEILKNVFNYKSIQQFIDSMSKEQWLKIKEWYNGSL